MQRPIRVGHANLSVHDASARQIEAVLLRHGHVTERYVAPDEELFRRMAHSEVDLLVSAWLPTSHGQYVVPLDKHVRKLAVLYKPYRIWGVPAYVPESAVATIKDLMRPEVLARMDRRIQAPHGDAAISRASAAIVDIYGLDMAGYHFEPVKEANCVKRFEQAVAEARWVVLPLWHPHRLHHRFAIRALREPLGILGGAESATLLVRRSAQSVIGRAAITDLARLRLGNALVSELDDVLP